MPSCESARFTTISTAAGPEASRYDRWFVGGGRGRRSSAPTVDRQGRMRRGRVLDVGVRRASSSRRSRPGPAGRCPARAWQRPHRRPGGRRRVPAARWPPAGPGGSRSVYRGTAAAGWPRSLSSSTCAAARSCFELCAPRVFGLDRFGGRGDRGLCVGLTGLGRGRRELGLLLGGLRGGRAVRLFVAGLLQSGDGGLLIATDLVDDRCAVEQRAGVTREVAQQRTLAVAHRIQTANERIEVVLRERDGAGGLVEGLLGTADGDARRAARTPGHSAGRPVPGSPLRA